MLKCRLLCVKYQTNFKVFVDLKWKIRMWITVDSPILLSVISKIVLTNAIAIGKSHFEKWLNRILGDSCNIN